ncbi:MAG: hypothetical protein ABI579_08935, partial [Candidatus Sumerlaeota bacterium]
PTSSMLSQELLQKANDYLAFPHSRWGPEPLFQVFLYTESCSTHDDSFAEYLLDQLQDDNIEGNAIAAQKLYLIGLREDFDYFFPPLLTRALSIMEESQEDTLVDNLLLRACWEDQYDPKPFEWYRNEGDYALDVQFLNYRRLPDEQQDAIVELVVKWCSNDWYGFGDSDLTIRAAHRNTQLAWSLLELNQPVEKQALYDVMTAENASSEQRTHAFMIWMLKDSNSLFAKSANRRAIVETLVGDSESRWCYGHVASFAGFFGADVRAFQNDELDDNEERICDDFSSSLGVLFNNPISEITPDDPRPGFKRWRQEMWDIAREDLPRESMPFRQLKIAKFLSLVKDPEAKDEIIDACISNTVDDDEDGNAAEAGEILDLLSFDKDVDAMRAGFNVGAELEDIQMIDFAFRYLSANDETFHAEDYPGVIAFMVDQLRNDDITGNAAEAVAYLRQCGETVKPLLEELAENSDDRQQRDYARRIIADIDFIASQKEEGIPYEMPPRYVISHDTYSTDVLNYVADYSEGTATLTLD